jgi:hypothetical protein
LAIFIALLLLSSRLAANATRTHAMSTLIRTAIIVPIKAAKPAAPIAVTSLMAAAPDKTP